MREADGHLIESAALEAPGDFLSELLAVSEAELLRLRGGGVRELPVRYGLWRVLAPVKGELRVTAGEPGLTLRPGQAAAVCGTDAAESALPTTVLLKSPICSG